MSKYFIGLLSMLFIAGSSYEATASGTDIYVISDLHLGPGKHKDDTGEEVYYKVEDFRWDDEFVEFIKDIIKKEQKSIDLIIAGDMFEMLQWGEKDTCEYDQNADLGCNEHDSLERIKIILKAHTKVIGALDSLLSASTTNNLVILPGNHDAAILYKPVQKEIISKFSSNNQKRVSIRNQGYWLTEDKNIYIDHGHQLANDTNSFEKWPFPFLINNGKRYIQRTFGERFVQKFFNEYEVNYPVIDNLSSEYKGVSYAASEGNLWENVYKIAIAAGDAKKMLAGLSTSQWMGVLGDQVDYNATVDEEGDQFILNSIDPEDELTRNVIKKAIETKEISVDKLTDQDKMKMCIYRQYLKDLKRNVTPCRKGLGNGILNNAYEYFFPGTFLSKHLNKVNEGHTHHEFKVYIQGHTHGAKEPSTFSARASWLVNTINSGAWQRVIDVDKLGTYLKTANSDKEKRKMAEMQPEELPACYSYVHIPPYENGQEPNPKLFWWGKDCQ